MNKLNIATALAFTSLLPGLSVSQLRSEEKGSSLKTTAYQTSVSQEQLRGSTRRLKDEMINLLDEFSQYQAASTELQRLKGALQELDNVTQEDMKKVVQTLREASRTESLDDTKQKMITASGEQKTIQSLLRALADRLALQRDEASIQQRLSNLALRQISNLRDTQKMADAGIKPDKVPQELKNKQAVTKAEQAALKEEVKMAMDTLRKLAANPEAKAREAFAEALKTGEENKVEEKAQEAAEKLATSLPEAAESSKAVSENLQKMVEKLNAGKSAEDQSRELAQQMKELSQQQEQLAKTSPKAWSNNQEAIKQQQEKIADKLEMAKAALDKVNPEASNEATKAKDESNQIAESLSKRDALNKVDNIAKLANEQKGVADKLEAASKMLAKQADALAQANNPEGQNENGENSPESESAPMSPAEAALADAVSQVMDARSEMSIAQRQLQQGGDKESAKQGLQKAQASLEGARQQAAKAGEAVGQDVDKNLQQSQAATAKAEQGVGVGSKQDQERSQWNIDAARREADKALEGLQKAANALAAQAAAAKEGQGMAENKPPGEQPGKGPVTTSKGKAGGGSKGKGTGSEDSISATSKRQEGQREALSLLQTEKAPSEYEAMVQQYVRNLADGELPAQ